MAAGRVERHVANRGLHATRTCLFNNTGPVLTYGSRTWAPWKKKQRVTRKNGGENVEIWVTEKK